jgi:hypothetical protein
MRELTEGGTMAKLLRAALDPYYPHTETAGISSGKMVVLRPITRID